MHTPDTKLKTHDEQVVARPKLRGTALSPPQMLLRGCALALLGCLFGVGGILVGGVSSFVGILLAAVLVHVGVSRLLWGWRGHQIDLLLWICAGWLLALSLASVFAPWLPLPEARNASAALSEPIYQPPFTGNGHLLGTNASGLDLLGRVIHGARTSLTISLGAVSIGILVGGLLGVLAGYARGKIDRTISVVTNAVLSVPPLILLIALAAILEPSTRNMAFALAALTIPSMIRIARASTISFAQRDFITAAALIGAKPSRVMLRELVPNVALPLMSMGLVTISALIVAEASLSFLGLGVPQPAPTWGNMISEAQAGTTLREYPFIVLVPGMVLLITVFALNLLGEKAQQRWDPRSSNL